MNFYSSSLSFLLFSDKWRWNVPPASPPWLHFCFLVLLRPLDEPSLVWVWRLWSPPFLLDSPLFDPLVPPCCCSFGFVVSGATASAPLSSLLNQHWHHSWSWAAVGVTYWQSSQPGHSLLIMFSLGPLVAKTGTTFPVLMRPKHVLHRGQTGEPAMRGHPVYNPFRVKAS